MNNLSKFLLLIVTVIIVSGCKEKLAKPIVYFENYDFSTNKYKLEFYHLEGNKIEGFENFYIDNPEVLNKIKTEWIFTDKSDIMPCGYSYQITLKENDKPVKKTLVNLDCEYMAGWIYFPEKYITSYKTHFKRMV